MKISNFYTRIAGPGGVLVLWAGVSTSLILAHMSIVAPRPLSYLGINPRTALVFNISLFVASLFFLAFFRYVYRNFSTSRSFAVAFIVGQFCQMIVAIVPVQGSGHSHAIHTAAGLTLGISLPIVIWRFAKSQTAPTLRRYARLFSYIELVLCIIGVILSRNTIGPLAEILAAVGFDVWIIWLALTKPQC